MENRLKITDYRILEETKMEKLKYCAYCDDHFFPIKGCSILTVYCTTDCNMLHKWLVTSVNRMIDNIQTKGTVS